ncbi:hypothetical protein ABPG72_005921 [Tetrahymena utriculariae]
MSTEDNKQQIEKQVDKFTNALLPVAKEFTAGSIFGFCAGYFSRNAVKYAAFVTGGAFIFLQVLSHKGYITMNMNKIEQDLKNAADLDGDGKITTNDAKVGLKKLLSIIGDKVPNATGFVAAYLLGLSGKLL